MEREKIVLAALPQLHIVKFAREHGRVTISNAIQLTGANRNTLKQQDAGRRVYKELQRLQ